MRKVIRDVVIACLNVALALGIFLLCNFAGLYLFDLAGIDRKVYAGVCDVFISLLSLGSLCVFWRIDRKISGEFISFAKPLPSRTVCSAITAVGLTGLVVIYMLAANYLSDYINSFKENLDQYKDAVNRYSEVSQKEVPLWDSLIYIVALFTIIPLSEEFLFRGIVMGQLRKAAPGWLALLLQAVIFGLMHGITIHIGYALICGIVLGAVYMFCDNLWMSVLVHGIFNLLGSALPTFLALEQFGIPKETRLNTSYIMSLVEYFMMFPAALAFVYLWYKYKKSREANSLTAEEPEPVEEGVPC